MERNRFDHAYLNVLHYFTVDYDIIRICHGLRRAHYSIDGGERGGGMFRRGFGREIRKLKYKNAATAHDRRDTTNNHENGISIFRMRSGKVQDPDGCPTEPQIFGI